MLEILGACAAILLTLGLAWAITVPPRPTEKALAVLVLGLGLLATYPPAGAGGSAFLFGAAKFVSIVLPLAAVSWRPWSPERGAWLTASIGPLMMFNITQAVVLAAYHGAFVNAAVGVGLILLQPMTSTGRLVHDRAGPFHVWCHYGFTRWWIVAYTLWNIGFVVLLYAGIRGLGLQSVMIVASLLFPLVATWRRPERWLALRVYTLAAAILMRLLSSLFEEAGLGALNGILPGTYGMLLALCNLAALPLLVMLAAATPPPGGSALAALRAQLGRRAHPIARP